MVGGRLASLGWVSVLPFLLATSCASKDAADAIGTADSRLDQNGDVAGPPDVPPQDLGGEHLPLDSSGSDVSDTLHDLGDLSSDLDAVNDLDLSNDLDTEEDLDVMTDLADDHEPPLISNLAVAPGEANVVSAQITFTTNEKAVWKLRRTDMVTGIQQTVTPTLPATKNHKVPVVGLRASRSYEFVLTVSDLAGNEVTTEVLPFQTQALPDDFPPLRFLGSQKERMQPGLTLFNVLDWADIQGRGMLVVVDDSGEVVWYYPASAPLVESLRTPDGTILSIIGEYDGIVEIDVMGSLLDWWKPEELGLDSLHHAVGVTSEGHLLSLATELVKISGYRTSSGGTTAYWVVGEIAVEFTRSRELIRSWPLLSVLDPYSYNQGFFLPFWLPLYPQASGGAKDWGHGNGILEVNGGSSYLVTLANQDMVVCLDKATGQPLWKAGPSGDVVLETGGHWFSYPHGVDFTPDMRMLVYDDGTYKDASPPRSRIVEYQLTAPTAPGDAWHATQIWDFDGGALPFYSYSPADVDYLENGNRLVLHGSLLGKPGSPPLSSGNTITARLVELALTPKTEPVFTLELGGDWDTQKKKLSSFAALRIPRLYPDAWLVEETPPDCQAVCLGYQCGTKMGCNCGGCSFGKTCFQMQCVTCQQACLGRECGALDFACDCGVCPAGEMCDEAGACQPASLFCVPYCEGKECGLVGAIYLGQTCDCGVCQEPEVCDYQTNLCAQP